MPFWKRRATPDVLPAHESAVRRLMSDASGTPYHTYQTLTEAQAAPDAVVILEGDDGGQIYVVARVSCVSCSEASLHTLLSDIDSQHWNDLSMAHVYFERVPVGQGVSGGMGGAVATGGVWVHPELQGIASAIEAVLAGTRPRITVA